MGASFVILRQMGLTKALIQRVYNAISLGRIAGFALGKKAGLSQKAKLSYGDVELILQQDIILFRSGDPG